MEPLLSHHETSEAIGGLCRNVLDHWPNLQDDPPAVIGVRTRGEVLADRLVQCISAEANLTVDTGVLDITFYRDDLSRRKGVPLVRATEIDFDIDDRAVLLVDDVLHTGRSIRAALDALTDFGRPRLIRLAVLIDRGGRELPIAADYVGARLDVPDNRRVQVRLEETDGEDAVMLIKRPMEPRPRRKG